MAQKTLDENDRHQAGTLPADPSADASPMVDTGIHRATIRLVTENVDPETLPLPNDVHTEAQLLAALLWYGTNSPKTLSISDIQDILESKDRFFSPVHQDIYEAMLTAHTSLLPTSVTNVNARLKRWGKSSRVHAIEHLEALKSSANPTDRATLRGYAEAIRDAWARRKLVDIVSKLNADARKAVGSCSEIVEKAHTSLVDLSRDLGASSSFTSFKDTAISMLRKAATATKNSIPTGLPALDELTGGWFPREVTIIAARTSVGKSALSTQLSFDGIRDRPNEAVLYVSLEMPAEQFTARILSARSGIPLRKIRRAELTRDDTEALRETLEEMKNSRVYFVDSQVQTIMSISSIASRMNATLMRDGIRLALIVVDHIGLVKPSSGAAQKNREQQVAETSRGLKFLAQHHGCHVFGLAQISRESEKQTGKSKIPQLFHLRESGAIEQDAENIIIIHRDKDERGMFKKNSPAILNVCKARNDALGQVWCAFEDFKGRFIPWEDSEYAKARAPGHDER
jgi:replicative DNA helicase